MAHLYTASPGAPPGMDADSLCVDPGSNFSYVVSATTSQTRLWRATCVGDALFAGGRVAEAARLWVGVAQASRVHALPPQLWTGVVTKLRNAGAALHESALFVTTSLELVGGADGDATPACRREWLEAAAAMSWTRSSGAEAGEAVRPLIFFGRWRRERVWLR